jgi:hypothetical protein
VSQVHHRCVTGASQMRHMCVTFCQCVARPPTLPPICHTLSQPVFLCHTYKSKSIEASPRSILCHSFATRFFSVALYRTLSHFVVTIVKKCLSPPPHPRPSLCHLTLSQVFILTNYITTSPHPHSIQSQHVNTHSALLHIGQPTQPTALCHPM